MTSDVPAMLAAPFAGLRLERTFGFRTGERGTHGSRSMMLTELDQLLDATPAAASQGDYRQAVLDENACGKGTASARLWTWKKLREIYGLDLRLAVFRCLRQLWDSPPNGRPLLAVLAACARDPLLRASSTVVCSTPVSEIVTADDFRQAVAAEFRDRFTPKTLRSVGGNLFSTWTQSGHLVGGRVRRRSAPLATPEVVTYALVLGRLTGARGPLLFRTPWMEILGLAEGAALDLAARASSVGWIDLRRAGSIVEVGFSRLLASTELEALS